MKKLAALAILALTLAPPSRACINTFEPELMRLIQKGDAAAIENFIIVLDGKHGQLNTLKTDNDRAVARIMVGRYDEAIGIFRDIEKRNPGNARVAANLGTALELKGDDVGALEWIREGVRRDAKEHRGTEWLHVRILEAKQMLATQPDWLQAHTVLGLDFGAEVPPSSPGDMPVNDAGSPRKKAEVMSAIDYQLAERIKFVRPPDAIVADLYAAAGNLALEGSKDRRAMWDIEFDRARSNYLAALRFKPVHAELIEKRLAFVQAQLAEEDSRQRLRKP